MTRMTSSADMPGMSLPKFASSRLSRAVHHEIASAGKATATKA